MKNEHKDFFERFKSENDVKSNSKSWMCSPEQHNNLMTWLKPFIKITSIVKRNDYLKSVFEHKLENGIRIQECRYPDNEYFFFAMIIPR